MTIEKAFNRAMRRAIKTGYDPIPGGKVTTVTVRLQTNVASFVALGGTLTKNGKSFSFSVGLDGILFDHEFAKRVWGSAMVDAATGLPASDYPAPIKAYEYHLQQLALLSTVKGRLAYIGSTM